MFPFKRNLVTYILTHLKPVFQIYFNWAGCGGWYNSWLPHKFQKKFEQCSGSFQGNKI